MIHIKWASYAIIWDVTIKSFFLKEGKWWNFDKLYSRHFELPGEWAPTSLSNNSTLRWKSDLFSFLQHYPFFNVAWCILFTFINCKNSRCIHTGKYIFRVTKSVLIKKSVFWSHYSALKKKSAWWNPGNMRLFHFRTAEQMTESACTAVWDLWEMLLGLCGSWSNAQQPWQRGWRASILGACPCSLCLWML